MNLTGKIKAIKETKEIGTKGFKKRELVLTTDEKYPQDILIEFIQDNCVVLNNFGVGNNVDIAINIKGREWTNKIGDVVYFNTIQGWRIALTKSEEKEHEDLQSYNDDYKDVKDIEVEEDGFPF